MKTELRNYQQELLTTVLDELSCEGIRTVIQCATGFGKTLIACALIDHYLKQGKRVMFTVPRLTLIDQTIEVLERDGFKGLIGVIQASHPMTNPNKPIQVASVHSLQKRTLPDVDLIIVDECHIKAEIINTLIEQWDRIPFLGLSATPWRKGMGKHWKKLLHGNDINWLIENKFLVPFRVFAPSKPDLKNVSVVAGDYHKKQLSRAMREPTLIADIVKTWLTLGENRATILFAVNRAHAKLLQTRFTNAGVATGYIDCFTDAEERAEVRAQFHRGKIKVVCSVATLTLGIDWDVRCIILARPTKSEMLFVQILGRGIRTAEGKNDCLVFDHSDNHSRLGFITDIHHDSLDDGTPNHNATQVITKKPVKCSSCHFMKPAGVHVCPNCGFAPERQSHVIHKQGELEELRVSQTRKRQFYQELLGYADEKGYKRGWAYYTYMNKYGEKPPIISAALPPSLFTRNYVKHLIIKRSKARA